MEDESRVRLMVNVPLDVPTEGQIALIQLAADGASNDEIAARRSVSPKTVKSQLSGAMRRTGAKNRTQLVAMCLREGWIQ